MTSAWLRRSFAALPSLTGALSLPSLTGALSCRILGGKAETLEEAGELVNFQLENDKKMAMVLVLVILCCVLICVGFVCYVNMAESEPRRSKKDRKRR